MSRSGRIYGIHAVRHALQHAPDDALEIWFTEGALSDKLQALHDRASTHGVAIQRVARSSLDKMADGGLHQGVVLRRRPARVLNEADLEVLLDGLDEPAFLLVLDGVEDPHNLGACLRTADAAGVHAVIIPRNHAAGLTAVASKAACGAADTMPLVQVANLARTMKALKQRGIWLYGASADAEQGLYDTDLGGAVAIVMGAEGKGLRHLTAGHCDFLLSLPMAGQVESLNVSVATGVMLYEVRRQRCG